MNTMKPLFALAALCIVPAVLQAQAVDTTVCEILKSPASFNDKIVRIKAATVSAGFDEFVIKGEDCHHHIDAIWLSYPEGTKTKSGPLAIVQLQPARNFGGTVKPVTRTQVTLDASKDFKQFDALLAAPYKTNGICLGCAKNDVTATITGRIDAAVPLLNRDAEGKIIAIAGFGNLSAYPVRLVLQSVSDVAPHEINYGNAVDIMKSDTGSPAIAGDSTGAAHQIAKNWGPDNPIGKQIERAAAAFGKQGEDNGVEVGFGSGSDASPRIEQQGEHASPDGLLYNCTFDSGRLKGNALALAIVHIGEHIADLREHQDQAETLFSLENRAWVTTALAAIGARQKTLTIPGGYVIWNSAWPQSDINTRSGEALTEFLKTQALYQ